MAVDLKTVLKAINNADTLQLIKRRMRLDIMKTIVAISDPWVQAQVQRKHHIRIKSSPLKAAIFSKGQADQTIRCIRTIPTQSQKVQMVQCDRALRLKEESYGIQMAKVS